MLRKSLKILGSSTSMSTANVGNFFTNVWRNLYFWKLSSIDSDVFIHFLVYKVTLSAVLIVLRAIGN